jgi:ABC-2 type transport system ATP-binding protein
VSEIRTEALRKTYGEIVALQSLDLSVEAGTVFGFLGPNGAGKTTTLRLLAGLARPSSGQAWLAGEPAGPESRARAHIGYLPEEPRFYNWMSPLEFLSGYVGGLFGLAREQASDRAHALLERVGLADAARRRIGGFSRGMRQRLGLAQALMNRPRVLLLDEPVSALDPGGRRDMLEWIGELKSETTVFMSTHILEDVERICDTIGILHRGRLVVVEARQTLLTRYAVPAVEVEFDAPAHRIAAWAEAVRAKPGVVGTDVVGSVVTVRLQVADAHLSVQAAALDAGLPVVAYRVARPTLEDVFLRFVEA